MKHKSLLDLFEDHLKRTHLIPRGSKGLVAVSGGVDSIVLLDLLMSISNRYGLTLGIAHYNHGVREKNSDRDEKFVKSVANRWRLDFYRNVLPPQKKNRTESWEAYARSRRYQFFNKICSENGYNWVATGHHADDQIETILLHVIQGSGLEGLSGIREKSGSIIRPLLPFSKQQIHHYAHEHSLHFQEDETNLDLRHPRNFLRHKVIPHLKEMNPGLNKSISRFTRNMVEIGQFVDTTVQKLQKNVIRELNSSLYELKSEVLSSYPDYLQKRIILQLISEKGSIRSRRHHTWKELGFFLKHAVTGDRLLFPDGWEILKNRKKYLVRNIKSRGSGTKMDNIRIQLKDHHSIHVRNFHFYMEIVSEPFQYTEDPHTELVDYHTLLGKSLELRLWKAGDKMKPLGLDDFKKVSDILIDHKIDRFQKETQYVFTADGDIVWLCGVRLDDRYKLQSTTERAVKLVWSSVDNHSRVDK